MTQHNNFINGEWVAGASYTPNINPSNLSDVIGEYAQADAAQVETAVAAAKAAFPAWSTGGVQARSDALDKIGNEILARREELGTLLSREDLQLVAGILREPFWKFLLLVTMAKGGRYLVLAALTLGWQQG